LHLLLQVLGMARPDVIPGDGLRKGGVGEVGYCYGYYIQRREGEEGNLNKLTVI